MPCESECLYLILIQIFQGQLLLTFVLAIYLRSDQSTVRNVQLFCRIRSVDVVLELRLVFLWLVNDLVALLLLLRSLPQFG